MRDKLYRFMQGRNGMDELARMQSWLVLILLLVGMFTRIGLFSFVALILMIYMYSVSYTHLTLPTNREV